RGAGVAGGREERAPFGGGLLENLVPRHFHAVGEDRVRVADVLALAERGAALQRSALVVHPAGERRERFGVVVVTREVQRLRLDVRRHAGRGLRVELPLGGRSVAARVGR